MSRTALVTGSSGFVGRHMVAALEREGWSVYTVDVQARPDGTHPEFYRDMRTLFADPTAPWSWDLIVHCAAVVGGRTMIDGSPLRLAAEDLSIDAMLFRWLDARAAGHRPIVVYFSSSAAYPVGLQTGIGDGYRLSEDDISLWAPQLPDQTYGWVKLTGERLAAEAVAAGHRVHVFRPFSGYGSDQALDYPFPSFVERGRRRADPFEVWGPGTQVRDFVHIDDVVDTVFAAINAGHLDPVNIGTGRATSFLDLAELVMAAAGYRAPIENLPDQPVGVAYRVADVSAMNDLHVARVSLEEGIARALSRDG